MLKTDTKKFWRVINPKANDIITLIDSSGNVIPTNQCASALNDVFMHNFSSTTHITLPSTHDYDYQAMFPIIIEPAGIVPIISSLKLSSAPGHDLINAKFLKSTSCYSSIFLGMIFQQSLDKGSLPDEWKIGKVIPLHKSGDKHSPYNYRPISLTSIPCKMLEHILASNLASFLETNSFFHHRNMASARRIHVKHN